MDFSLSIVLNIGRGHNERYTIKKSDVDYNPNISSDISISDMKTAHPVRTIQISDI